MFNYVQLCSIIFNYIQTKNIYIFIYLYLSYLPPMSVRWGLIVFVFLSFCEIELARFLLRPQLLRRFLLKHKLNSFCKFFLHLITLAQIFLNNSS